MGKSDPGPAPFFLECILFYFILGLLVFSFDPRLRPQVLRGLQVYILGNMFLFCGFTWYLQVMVYFNLNLLVPSLLVVLMTQDNPTGSCVHKDLLVQIWIMYITVMSLLINGHSLWLQSMWNALMHAQNGNIIGFLLYYVSIPVCFVFSKMVSVTYASIVLAALSGTKGLMASKVAIFIGLVGPVFGIEVSSYNFSFNMFNDLANSIVELLMIRHAMFYWAQMVWWFANQLQVNVNLPFWIHNSIVGFVALFPISSFFFGGLFLLEVMSVQGLVFYAYTIKYHPLAALSISIAVSPIVFILVFRVWLLITDVALEVIGVQAPGTLYLTNFVRFDRNLLAACRKFSAWGYDYLSHPMLTIIPIRAFLLAVSLPLKLPAELWLRVMEHQEDLWITIEPISHLFYFKLFLSVQIFMWSLFGIVLLLKVAVALAVGGFFAGILSLYIVYGPAIFAVPVVVYLGTIWSILSPTNTLAVLKYCPVGFRIIEETVISLFLLARVRSGYEPKIAVQSDDGFITIKNTTRLNLLERTVISKAFVQVLALSTPIYFISLAVFIFFVTLYWICEGFTKVVLKPAIRVPARLFRAIFLATIPFLIPDLFYDIAFTGLAYSYIYFVNILGFSWDDSYKVLRFMGLAGAFRGHYLDGTLGPEADEALLRGGFDQARLSTVFIRSWVSMTRRSVLRFVETLEQLTLPEMIQAAYKPATIDSIRATYVTLREIGFPVQQSFIDSFTGPESSAYLAEWGSWRNWLLGTSNFALGFRKAKVGVHKWLEIGSDILNFHPEVPGNIHTTTYTGPEPEIRSTARYWTNNHQNWTMDNFIAGVDDLYYTMESQFKDSKLSSFKEIFKGWKKNFNMGFGFSTVTTKKVNRLKQLTRAACIDMMGGHKNFLSAWARVFKEAQTLAMPAPVFTKWENLKLKKSITRSVRTVIGSAFSHHVMTTVFNYRPNHNYRIWETPVKIGMPLNGQNFNRLWSSLLGFTHVWAGDMTAFDSTQSPVVVKMVAEMRKRGYSLHKDYHKICQLIDISYDMLRDHPLGFKNLGDIAIKGQGFTTGHSSTSTDNSLALVCNYLYAWRRVTGLRAREFFNFNKLANFGDDHILGYDPVFGWSPQAAIRAMQELGTEMRDESPGQSWLPGTDKPLPEGVTDWRDAKFSFLAKQPLPLSPDIVSELAGAGVKVPLNFATCHDRTRLLGKIKGQVTSSKANKTENSYAALLAYMYLCAHHRDLFEVLARKAGIFYTLHYDSWIARGVSPKNVPAPPTYNQVLRQWYSSEPFPYLDDELTEDEDGSAVFHIFDTPDPFGVFVRWISDFPTLLSPRYANTRWADWIQQKLADRLSWPLTFVAKANSKENELSVARMLCARTPYSFLRNESLHLTSEPFGNLIVRHWLYMWLTRYITNRKAFSPLDLLRLFDSVFVNALFIMCGHVTQVLVELDLHVLETLLVYFLSFITLDLRIPVVDIFIPSPSLLAGQLLSYTIRYFSPAGAIDFQSFDAAIRRFIMANDLTLVLSAPTGVGKSTRLMNRLSDIVQRRVVVIVPRRLVAISVCNYMKSLYPNSGIGVMCEGFKLRGDERLIYTTAQSFFASDALRSPGSVFVVDEAHLDEPHYITLKNYFTVQHERVIYITATPSDDLLRFELIEIPAVNQNKILDISLNCKDIADYINAVVSFCNDRAPSEKILIFLPTKKQQVALAQRLVFKYCIINSSNLDIDQSASVFITTNVADAGVTIPDVAFVFTTNVDVFVTSPDVDMNLDPEVLKGVRQPYTGREQEPEKGYFSLTTQTLKQRRGRTGRTLDGVSTVYTLSNIQLSQRIFSAMDFLNTFAVAIPNAAPFFPAWVKAVLPPSFVDTYPLWDLVSDRTYTNLTYYLKQWKEFQSQPRDIPVSLLQWTLENVANVKTKEIIPTLKNDQRRRLAPDDYDDSWKLFTDPDTKEKVVDPKWSDQNPPNPPHPKGAPALGYFRRVNVSGEGLLCGARALQGLLYTHYGVAPTIDFLALQIRNSYVQDRREFLNEDAENNFHFDVLREVAYRSWNLAIRCITPTSDIPFRGFDDEPHDPPPTSAVVFLANNHYNYYGVPVAGEVSDEFALSRLYKPILSEPPRQASPDHQINLEDHMDDLDSDSDEGEVWYPPPYNQNMG